MSLPTLSVIVPAHVLDQNLRRCIARILQSLEPGDACILVADGIEPDQLAHGFDDVLMVHLPAGSGPAKARNLGARFAQGDVLLFIDSDVLVADETIAAVRMRFAADAHLDALFGSYDDTPAAPNFVSQYKNLFHHFVHQQSGEEASTFWAGCGAVRREVFLDLGGFDETYISPSIEDIEFGYRLRHQGRQIRLQKGIQVKHLKKWTLRSLLFTDFFRRALPWTALIWREREMINDLNLAVATRVSIAAVFALLLSLLAAVFLPSAGLLSLALAVLLLALNHSLYRFFLRKRGFVFLLIAIPCHWAYFFYSGIAFIWGSLHILFRRSML